MAESIDPSKVARHEAASEVEASVEVIVDLTHDGMPGRFEALWATSSGGYEHEIRSIPFFAYGVARSDIVRTVVADEGLRFDGIVRRAGHRTLRVAIKDERQFAATHEALHASVSSSGLASEWHAAGLVAVDLPEPGCEAWLAASLKALATDGLIEFEIDEEV